jgi:cyclopropane fatty-acyl-phospholipid synthase-like methyltransferase
VPLPELRPAPSPDWRDEWDALMTDAWLRRKTDRDRRMGEHLAYVDKFLPEIKAGPPGIVIDIGPGCGELLEIAREYGHTAIGVDAPNGKGGMGSAYVKACRLIHKRQGLHVEYHRALEWLQNVSYPRQVVAVNFRGSVEQVWSEFMDGPPHDETHEARRLSWRIGDALTASMRETFHAISKMLRPGGVLMVHANGAKNATEYDELVRNVAAEFLQLVHHEPPTVHKWVKV